MDAISRLIAAIAEARARMGGGGRMPGKGKKNKKTKVAPRAPAKTGPSAGCGTGAGGFKAGNNCAKEDGIPRKPLGQGGALKKADAKADIALAKKLREKAKARRERKEALDKAKSEAARPAKEAKEKQRKIDYLRKKAAERKAAKDQREAAEKQAAKEAADKKRAAMLQIIRVKSANTKLEIAGTPKSIKQEIEELKLKKASEPLKVVATPKSIREELDELKASVNFKSAPAKAPAESKAIGQGLYKKTGEIDDDVLDQDREIVFGKHNKDGWKYGGSSDYTKKNAAAKRVKHEIASDLSSRIAKSGIKESDVSDEMLLSFDRNNEFYGTTSAKERLLKAGVPESMHRRYALAAGMTRSWAETSGDSVARAVGVQFAIRKELKVSGALTKHFGSEAKKKGLPWGKEQEDIIKRIQDNKAVRAVVRAQYQATQDHLKKIGVTHLVLARGWSGSTIVKQGQDQDISLQPASSFSMHKSVSYMFSGGPSAKKRGIVGTVPADRIFSTCVTGFGCLGEQEVVVLGGKFKGRVSKLSQGTTSW